MSLEEYSMQQLVSLLHTAHFQSYLLNHGWVETPSRYANQLRFETKMENCEEVYEMYVPAAAEAAKFQTRLLRNIYKLCSIEDREAGDIAREMIANYVEVKSTIDTDDATRLRVHNTGSTPLLLNIDSPDRQHTLHTNEAIELMCCTVEDNILEIERKDNSLNIRTARRK